MFTGIVTDIGSIDGIESGKARIACSYDPATIVPGASIACDGCCLTVTAVEAGHGVGSVFAVDISNETLSRTTLGQWSPGRAVNLERSLKLGDELGGHLVTGHIDGVARIVAAAPDGDSTRFDLACPPELMKFVAEKGSVALDGTSLTVNAVSPKGFAVNIIPHTQAVTTWGQKGADDLLNMEVDLMARYVARLNEREAQAHEHR